MKNKFQINDPFWSYYQELVGKVMLPYQYEVLNDSLDDPDIEKSHSFENFRIAAGESDGAFYGQVFQDSDTAKWLEAVAYSLMVNPDEALEKKADEIIALIGRAQQPDGYLNTYFIAQNTEKRWQNLQECHELYCAGHMIEAGVAYYEATGKEELLSIVRKNADLIYRLFITEKREGVAGHPEIELALVRLYRVTGDARYLTLAKHFIDVRGTNPNFFAEERQKSGWSLWNMNPQNTDYTQVTHPVREEQNAVGHAVRAVYLYTGMAMTAKETNDPTLTAACERMWDSIVNKRMYLTGGIGSSAEAGEAFTLDYDLPNSTAYSETCAAIGLIFFAKAMLELTHDAKYADVMELALYNTVLAGVQRDGTRFFYTNPLEADPAYIKKLPGLQHVYAKRPKWHACACCPPNEARLLASLNRYAWHEDGEILYSDLFISGEYRPDAQTTITTETGYPYDGVVTYHISSAKKITFAVRMSAWSPLTSVAVNGSSRRYRLGNQYVLLENLVDGDTVSVQFDLTPSKMYANPKVHADEGKCAIMAGPLVYCFEDCDNGDLNQFSVSRIGDIHSVSIQDERIGNVNILKVPAWKFAPSDSLYSFQRPKAEPAVLTAVPYYAWGNREIGKMKVWIWEY
ncbi:MAG: glycoside hydrolase family 127 protein [Eubacteriales bacterium]|nr:glycoside hydrolase family 127 protein [Eubacteriales bacterium]